MYFSENPQQQIHFYICLVYTCEYLSHFVFSFFFNLAAKKSYASILTYVCTDIALTIIHETYIKGYVCLLFGAV